MIHQPLQEKTRISDRQFATNLQWKTDARILKRFEKLEIMFVVEKWPQIFKKFIK